jgi:NADH-quinone oxidoreductase subunit A
MKFPDPAEVTAETAPAAVAPVAPAPVEATSVEYAAIPVFLFAAVTVGMAASLPIIGGLFGPKRSGKVKNMPYESGMDPIHDTRRRFDVRFHLVAIAFLVFDVELLFLYPWAVALKREPPESGKSAPAPVVVLVDGSKSMELTGAAAKTQPKVSAAEKPAAPEYPPRGIDAAAASGAVRAGAFQVGDDLADAYTGGRMVAFFGAMFFIAMLTVGLIYDWKKGVFQWR